MRTYEQERDASPLSNHLNIQTPPHLHIRAARSPTMLLKAMVDNIRDEWRRWGARSRPGQTNAGLIGLMCLTSLSPLVRSKAPLLPVKIFIIDFRSAITCLWREWVLLEVVDMMMCCSLGHFSKLRRADTAKTNGPSMPTVQPQENDLEEKGTFLTLTIHVSRELLDGK